MPAIPSAPVQQKSIPLAPNKPQTSRSINEDEKKLEFKLEPGDSVVESFDVQQLESTTPAKKEDKVEAKVIIEGAGDLKKEVTTEAGDVEHVEEVKPITPTKTPVKTTEATEQKKEEVVKPLVPPSADQSRRDYTGFSPEEVVVLKNMSKQSYEYVSKIIKEKRELEGLKDAQYMQHPDAYVLSPEYKQTQNEQVYFQQMGDYWQTQLAEIKQAKPWYPIIGWNDDGSPKIGAARQPTPNDEEQVRLAMQNCYSSSQQSQGKLQGLAQNHTQRVKQDLQNIEQEQKRRFAWIDDPKLLDSVVDVEGLGERSIKQIQQDFTSLFPIYMQRLPVTQVAANMFVALQIYAQKLREAEAGKQIAEIKQQEVTRAEPTSTQKPPAENGKTVAGIKEFSVAGLPE